ncbi:MAG: DUF1569 domain-containing protein [Candidatus Aminicenantes bacterium]|nr:DUF1569 domain-containing protein [Candidatus Aminicenantes bacterium]
MKNLFNEIHLEEMKARVEKLDSESVARWGKFSVQRMVCHLLDNLEYALGITEGKTEAAAGPPMFIRHLIRLYIPFPKGKIRTSPGMLKRQPGEWEKDKRGVIELLDQFLENRDKEPWPIHPFFGRLSGPAWSRLIWRHFNHHLSQFGV